MSSFFQDLKVFNLQYPFEQRETVLHRLVIVKETFLNLEKTTSSVLSVI